MSDYKIEARNICKIFAAGDSRIEALRDLTIRVRSGEFVSLVGASGCGKTTLLRILDGLIEPTSGAILVDGKPANKIDAKRAFVFQQDSLFPWRSVMRNTLLGPEIQRKPMDSASQIASHLLGLVGLGSFQRRYPHELSGGMRQRVNLARALTAEPDILLMDEPFAALDAQTREIMQGELLRIWSETKKTVLLVTHQIDEAVFLSDAVFVLTVRPGRLKEEIRIDLPRPRGLAIKRTAEFVAYVDRIWKMIENEVRESMDSEVLNVAVGL